MTSQHEKDELSGIIDEIREYCAHKGVKVYPAWVSNKETLKVKWENSRADDWRLFLDIATALSPKLVYLHASPFDIGYIDNAKEKVAGNTELEAALDGFKTRIGQFFWYELGFFFRSVYHSYARTAEWYISFSDLTEEVEASLIPEAVEADPKLLNNFGELLATHKRFPECRNFSQKVSLLMDIAADDFDKLRPGACTKQVIQKADAYYFLKIQPQLDDKLRTEAQALRDQGLKLTQIARRLGVSRDKVRGLE